MVLIGLVNSIMNDSNVDHHVNEKEIAFSVIPSSYALPWIMESRFPFEC